MYINVSVVHDVVSAAVARSVSTGLFQYLLLLLILLFHSNPIIFFLIKGELFSYSFNKPSSGVDQEMPLFPGGSLHITYVKTLKWPKTQKCK